MSNTNLTERESKSTSRAMTEWLERQYDAPQQVDGGPEALAWDDHGLQAAGLPAAAQV
jgi:hypothetical protein